MISIIKDYLNKITVHSQSLSSTDKYINKPWVHIDNDGNYHKYIFNPDGDLFMSFNGKVEIGKWKYFKEANLIFIDRLSDKILLKQSFFDESVMILKIDGTSDDLFILVNENIIPDLDVAKYLSTLIVAKKEINDNNFCTKRLLNGNDLRIYRGDLSYTKVGMSVLSMDKNVPDGEYFTASNLENKLFGYQIEDSKIKELFWLTIHNTTEGIYKIFQKNEFILSIGDRVLFNENTPLNGTYKIGFMNHIKVKNGVISGTSIFK